MDKEQVKQFEDWKSIKKFLGWEVKKFPLRIDVVQLTYYIIYHNNSPMTSPWDSEEEAWKEAYQNFTEHSFEYWEDWGILMELITKVNEHIKKNSSFKYVGIVVYDNRVWIDSQPICLAIYKGNQSGLPKHKTQETLLLCAYEICLEYLKKYFI